MTTYYNHTGVAVSDLMKSQQFYENVLGFRRWWQMDVPDGGTDTLLQLRPPIGLNAAYLIKDEFVLELLEYRTLGLVPREGERVMNERGLTHLSFASDDIPAILAEVEANGGEVIEATNLGTAVMIRDPDGQLIELTGTGFRDRRPPLPNA